MKYEELPKEIQNNIDILKNGDKRIQEDILNILKSSDEIKDFKLKVDNYIDKIVENRVKKLWELRKKGIIGKVIG